MAGEGYARKDYSREPPHPVRACGARHPLPQGHRVTDRVAWLISPTERAMTALAALLVRDMRLAVRQAAAR